MINASTLERPSSVALRVPAPSRPNLDVGFHPRMAIVFLGVIALALFLIAYSIYVDVTESGVPTTSWLPFVLLGVALLVALGFEFVNGFHDTANAVATVIYTHSMPAHLAVVWSGSSTSSACSSSSGAVAYGIIALLPVELILQVGSSAGFAMVFALLIGAIIWNLGTWYLGLPASSSHTLIGSIIGVGLANQMMAATAASGVDWAQAAKVGYSLLLSPLIGFCLAALLLLTLNDRAESRALRRAEGGCPAAVLDPEPADPDLHRRQLRAWLERRPEGHGPDHADSDRRRADGLCAQPRHAGSRHSTVHRCVGTRRAGARPAERRPNGCRPGRLSAIIFAPVRRHRTSCRRWPP